MIRLLKMLFGSEELDWSESFAYHERRERTKPWQYRDLPVTDNCSPLHLLREQERQSVGETFDGQLQVDRRAVVDHLQLSERRVLRLPAPGASEGATVGGRPRPQDRAGSRAIVQPMQPSAGQDREGVYALWSG